MKRLLGIVTVSLIIFSCGGSLQDTSSVPEVVPTQLERNGLVFDPFVRDADAPISIPFPNDLFWGTESRSEQLVYLDPSSTENPAMRVLYEAINKLNIKGLSPNLPIFVPLVNETPIDTETLRNRYILVDMTSGENHTGRLTFVQDGRYLKFYPVEPLEAGHRYAFLLLSGIKDINGNPLLAPQVFEQQLEQQGIFDQLYGMLNLSRDEVLEAFTFTTADRTLSTKDFAAMKAYLASLEEGITAELEIEGLSYDSIFSDYSQFDPGNSPQSQLSSPLYGVLNLILQNVQLKNALLQGLFPAFDITKLKELFNLIVQGQQFDVNDYVKFIPVYVGNRSEYNGNVYIFQHGLGRDKSQVEALLEDIPLTVIAIDLPFHGDYTKLTENSDFECRNGECFLTTNLPQNRLNIYQSVFNLRLLELLLRNGLYDLDGDGSPDTPFKVNFLGVSMGAITGAVYAKNSLADKIVLNVGGGNQISILDAATNELITSMLFAAGIEKNTNKYAITLGIFQLILDPADPVYLGTSNSTNIIVQSAYHDTVVPNVSNEALARKSGFPSYQQIVDPNTVPPASPGWYMFGDENNWVIHSFLIHSDVERYPEVVGHTVSNYVEGMQKAAREQIYNFFE